MSKPPLSYNPAYFVNREEETRLVRETAQSLAQNGSLKERAFIFTGQRGSGKTWLLHHLKDMLKEEFEKKARVVLIDLSKWSDLSAPEAFVCEVMSDFTQQIEAQARLMNDEEKESVPLDQWAEWLVHDVRQIAEQGRFLVLLLDSVYEAEWNHLSTLEDDFLGPLVVEPNVLVMMAGRGKPFPWRLPELWLYGKPQELEPFDDESQIREMLHKMEGEEEKAAQIHQLSDGYPYVAWMLSQRDATEYQIAMAEALDYMLPPEIVDLRDKLDTMCVLRAFDEDRIETLLSCNHSEAAEILNRLAEPKLTWYEQARRGYVLDDAIRYVLEQLLKIKNPQQWQQLHEQAQSLYEDWSREWGEEWKAEAQYHSQVLKEAMKV